MKAAHAESAAIPDSAASQGSTIDAPGISQCDSAHKERANIDVEISNAIAGISAEAQRAGRDEIEAALKDLTAVAERIQKAWSAA
jgi:hypothetical protein